MGLLSDGGVHSHIDHLLALLVGWAISNLYLVRLMVHKKVWQAAKNSGSLALKTLTVGSVALAGAAWLLANASGSSSIHAILAQAPTLAPSPLTLATCLIALAALTQSAAWPFHKWLTSSLNSPTPVSALMHAGLVNGGGFLLARFAPLFLNQPVLLQSLFAVGLLTALLGTFWKLLQSDIKRMLACSTMAQMGFMIAQCGMGLFAPAVSHLVWHGLFKAYLFLGTGSVISEKIRKNPFSSITLKSFIPASLWGAVGALAFAQAAAIPLQFKDTSSIMIGLAFMACMQLAGTVITRNSLPKLLGALISSILLGGLYGGSIRLIEIALAPLHLWQPQPLNWLYTTGFIAMAFVWLAMNINLIARLQNSPLWQRLYFAALNGSQPHPATVTATRSTYQF
jgi:NAD(P)H-quinone oxidoreductase subunit 5